MNLLIKSQTNLASKQILLSRSSRLTFNSPSLNICMKFFLVVIMCIGANCETMWHEEPYSSRFECEIMSRELVQDLSTTFPDSDGEIYCLTTQEYENWKKAIKDNTPKLRKNHPSNRNTPSI